MITDGQVLDSFIQDSGVSDLATRAGTGLLIEGRSNVVLRAAAIRGYWQNLVLRGCRNVLIEGGDFSDSHQPVLYSGEAYDERDWLDIFDESVWLTYGAGIVLEDCEDCSVTGARASGAQNGLMLINCRGCSVSDCDFSRNSGWGIWMWRSHHNTLIRNNCDECIRCEDPERYSAGGDSAGIMLSNDNCHNLITHNSFRFSGDGFFLNGLRVEPSENNLIAFNDGSHSPHNAFESSFSGGNRFIGNIASNSRYGFWCGYSHHNELVGNIVENNLEWGIAIEHGYSNRIVGNELRRNGRGIVLFRREPDGPASRDYLIESNIVTDSESAVTLAETTDVVLRRSQLHGEIALELKRSAHSIRVCACDLVGTDAVRAEPGSWASLSSCYVEGELPWDAEYAAPAEKPYGAPVLPSGVHPASAADRDDYVFRWYDPRKAPGKLVGTAEA